MPKAISPRSVSVKPRWTSFVALAAAWLAAGATGWEERQYNPRPAAGDVALPMPCDGMMVFRDIETEADGPLGDQRVRLGEPGAELGYIEAPMETYVAGAFLNTATASRYFLLGKYEVTQMQYQAVTSGDCTARPDGDLPQTGVNWFDAVSFADQYSRWLLKNARNRLLSDGESIGFVRLPTEVEWEFAARGGRRLSPADFQARTFPMPKGMNAYVWYSGNDSASGQVQPIGLLEPNPLGLHGILGNVDEIVFDLFRLTKHSRWHGRAGAYVVRGGNFTVSPDQIRASFRQEVPYYKDDQPRRTKTTGLRVAVSAPVLSRENLPAIKTAWMDLTTESAPEVTPVAQALPEKESTMDPNFPQRVAELEFQLQQCQGAKPGAAISYCPDPMADLSADSPDDPLLDLRDLVEKARSPVLKRRLGVLQANLSAIVEAQSEKRSRAAREALRTAAMICQKLRDDELNLIRNLDLLYRSRCTENQTTSECRAFDTRLKTFRSRATYNLGFYSDAVLELTHSYPLEILTSEKNLLITDLQQRTYKDFIPFVKLFFEHVQHFSADGRQDRDGWYKGCIAVPLNEE